MLILQLPAKAGNKPLEPENLLQQHLRTAQAADEEATRAHRLETVHKKLAIQNKVQTVTALHIMPSFKMVLAAESRLSGIFFPKLALDVPADLEHVHESLPSVLLVV